MPVSLARYGLVLLLIMAGSGTGVAQTDTSGFSHVYLDGGVMRPVSPDGFQRYWNPGNRIRIGVEWQTPRVFTLRAGLTYGGLLLDRDRVAEELDGAPSGRSFDDYYYLAELTADVLLHAPTPVTGLTPYAVVGLGVQLSDLAGLPIDRPMARSDLETEIGASLVLDGGIGLRRRVFDGVDVFAEGLLVGSFTGGNDKAYTPFTFGLAVRMGP